VIFNYRSLRVFKECVVRYWRKALGKRSQKGRMNWTGSFPHEAPHCLIGTVFESASTIFTGRRLGVARERCVL